MASDLDGSPSNGYWSAHVLAWIGNKRENVMLKRHRIQFPNSESQHLDQDEVFFYLDEDGEKIKLRFHDYAEIYKRPGLYEQIFMIG